MEQIRARELMELAGSSHPSKDWLDRLSRLARGRKSVEGPKIKGSRERVAKTLRWLGRTPTEEMVSRYSEEPD